MQTMRAIADRRLPYLAALFTLLIATLVHLEPAQSQAARIDSVSPLYGRAGDRVTLVGIGFGAIAVRVTVGRTNAVVAVATGNRVTFVVPAGVAPGAVVVTATNPGGRSSSIGFEILDGVLLIGDDATPASAALADRPPVPVPEADIDNGVMLTRLGARLTPYATVGQVNAALAQIRAGIVTMHPATLSVTLAVPRQETLADLKQLAAVLEARPGIRGAWPAMLAATNVVRYNASSVAQQRFGLPSRFPAAWNAYRLVVRPAPDQEFTCRHPRVPLVVADVFGLPVSDVFTANFPGANNPAEPGEARNPEHGYLVALAAGGLRGANPFWECLDLRLVQLAGLSVNDSMHRIAAQMPAGRFILNYSMGYADTCKEVVCKPVTDRMVLAKTRAYDTIEWKELSLSRWNDFLVASAAGNERNATSAVIWPAARDARVGSPIALAAKSDPVLGLASNDSWTPEAALIAQEFESLATTPLEQLQLGDDVRLLNLDGADAVPENVILVGSATNMDPATATTQYVSPDQLVESAFSDENADVQAVGEEIFGLVNGTSFASPQVAGLASYLWLLSPELRTSQPIAMTQRAIVANTRSNVIDAYATVLSLDGAVLPTPVTAPIRLAILDVDGVDGFNEADIEAFLSDFYFVDAAGNITRQPPEVNAVTLEASDLNGDGFSTSISRRERFDLDRLGSTRFGQTSYGFVSQLIEGQTVRFDEAAVTDVEILCYYAYSGMYQGNPDARRTLLDGRCGLSIDPASVTLVPGGVQQFTANAPVIWTASGGTISASGLFTAGSTAGTFSVQARSSSNPETSAFATVTVAAPPPPPTTSQVRGPYDGQEERGQIGEPTVVRTGRWAIQTVGTAFRIVRESGVGTYVCQQTGIAPFQCSPPFDLTNGAFTATAGGKMVSGTLSNGQLQFVLEEPCVSNFEIVQCRTQFSGQLVRLQLAPARLDFGSVAVGSSGGTQSLSITNLGLLPIRVFVTLPLGFSIVGHSCASGTGAFFFAPEAATCEVSVEFRPPLVGSFGGAATISGDGGPEVFGTTSLSGQGQPPP